MGENIVISRRNFGLLLVGVGFLCMRENISPFIKSNRKIIKPTMGLIGWCSVCIALCKMTY